MKYYKMDSRKISFREYWRMSPKSFWFAWLNKICGIQMNFIRGMTEPQPFKSRIINSSDVPKDISEQLNSGLRDLQKLGFDQFWYFSSKQSLTGGLGYGVEGLHSSRQILAKVIYVSYKTKQRLTIVFFSGFQEGVVLSTTNKKREFNPLPKHIGQRIVGADAESLFNLHQKKIAGMSHENTPQIFAGLDEVAAFGDRLSHQNHDDKIKRGIWVEMTDAEVTALRAQRGVPPPLPAQPGA